MNRAARYAALLLVCASAAGCGVDNVSQVPLPGGADLGPHPYHVTASFPDVLDLVPQSGVKVDDVAVGKVTAVGLAPDGRSARVTLAVNGDVVLPANAVARLRQSSVLGEKFVELAAPADAPARGRLADGAVLSLSDSSTSPQIEEVLGALSLLLNGGGLGQIQTITRELNAALAGHEGAARSVLSQLDGFLGGLDAQRGKITRALDSVDRLSATLRAHQGQIADSLDRLPGGIRVLADQRAQLVTLLESLSRLSGVAVDTVNRGKDDLVADLRALAPVLRDLQRAGAALPRSLQMLLTFPFPDSALPALRGDYLNTFLTLAAAPQANPTDPANPAAATLPLPGDGGR